MGVDIHGNENKPNNPHVTLVMVTYGNRLAYLKESLSRCFAEPLVTDAVVVDNGSSCDLSEIAAEWPGRIDLVRLTANIGSAGGYRKAIAQALADGADYIWLMDDDNAPVSGCAELLWQELQKLSSEVGKSNAAVGGIRSEVLDVRRAYLKPATFMHFHVADLCYILLKRLRKGNNVPRVFPSQVEVPFWANGGMMLSREVYEKHGLPRDDFVMYGEDFEFTLRFTRGGGVIRLFRAAKVVDLEPSWASDQKNGFFYHPCIHAGSDFRIYYGIRNEVYIDRSFYRGNRIIYWINKLVYLGGLFFIALLSGKLARFCLILKAVADGEHGRLGARDEFVLP